MMRFRKLFIIPVLLLVTATGYSAEKEKKARINFRSSEVVFSIRLLRSADIAGEEVEPFMDIKKKFDKAYSDIKKHNSQKVYISFTAVEASNFLIFIQRGLLTGDEANMFQDISNRVIKAFEDRSKKGKKK